MRACRCARRRPGGVIHRSKDRLVAHHHCLSFEGLSGQALRHVATLAG